MYRFEHMVFYFLEMVGGTRLEPITQRKIKKGIAQVIPGLPPKNGHEKRQRNSHCIVGSFACYFLHYYCSGYLLQRVNVALYQTEQLSPCSYSLPRQTFFR
jgi:hypothetical protein